MKTIFKYNISINDCQAIEMPKDADILKTGVSEWENCIVGFG